MNESEFHEELERIGQATMRDIGDTYPEIGLDLGYEVYTSDRFDTHPVGCIYGGELGVWWYELIRDHIMGDHIEMVGVTEEEAAGLIPRIFGRSGIYGPGGSST